MLDVCVKKRIKLATTNKPVDERMNKKTTDELVDEKWIKEADMTLNK